MRGKKKINYKGWGRPAEGRRERICVASGAVRVFLLEEKEVVAGRFRREGRIDWGEEKENAKAWTPLVCPKAGQRVAAPSSRAGEEKDKFFRVLSFLCSLPPKLSNEPPSTL